MTSTMIVICSAIFWFTFSFEFGQSLSFSQPVNDAASWLLSQRRGHEAWSLDQSRILTGLASIDARSMATRDVLLSTQQVITDLALVLVRTNSSRQIPLHELAHYIRALIVACQDPKRFYGIDLVAELRSRTSKILSMDEPVVPSVILSLCVANSTTDDDAKSLYKTGSSQIKGNYIQRFDLEAYSSIAAACVMQRSSRYRNAYNDLYFRLLNSTVVSHEKSLQNDVYTLALLLQAINAWNSHPKIGILANQRKSIEKLLLSMQEEDGSFGDILATYYALPAIAGRSLLNMHRICSGGSAPARESSAFGEQINVRILLWVVKNGKHESNSISFTVKNGSTLYDALLSASLKNPIFRFKYDQTIMGKTAYEIHEVPNDCEKQLYWQLYINPPFTLESKDAHTISKTLPVPAGLDLIRVVDKDRYLFWYKSL